LYANQTTKTLEAQMFARRLTLGIMVIGLLAANAHAFPRKVLFEEITGHG
jgi:hypothetical protein